MSMTKQQQKTTEKATVVPAATTGVSVPQLPQDCPPDVDELGRSSWTLLHTMAASYPERPSLTQQSEVTQFISLFGKLYPCWVCAGDFQQWIKSGNEPRVGSRDEFGRWMCEAHNAVNEKLGKSTFNCNLWQERWRTGWKDGRCDGKVVTDAVILSEGFVWISQRQGCCCPPQMRNESPHILYIIDLLNTQCRETQKEVRVPYRDHWSGMLHI